MKLETKLSYYHHNKTHTIVHLAILHAYNYKHELFYHVNDPHCWFISYQQIIAAEENGVRDLIGVLHKLRYCLCLILECFTA